MTNCHPEQSEAESKDPVKVLFDFAAGLLNFARNDGHLIRYSSFKHSFVIGNSSFVMAVALLMASAISLPAETHDIVDLFPPTDNNPLISGDGAAFYQYVERNYKGEKSPPWEGGQYGFVRDPVDTASGTIYTRFHEGIDIRPMHRDANGEPIDEVRAIGDGKVVHANLVPG